MGRKRKEEQAEQIQKVETNFQNSVENSDSSHTEMREQELLDTADTLENEKPSEKADISDVETSELKPNEFVATGVAVKLRDIHPHDSYGRAGFRFNKTDVVEIPLDVLSDGKMLDLVDDPWLEVTYLTDK